MNSVGSFGSLLIASVSPTHVENCLCGLSPVGVAGVVGELCHDLGVCMVANIVLGEALMGCCGVPGGVIDVWVEEIGGPACF